MAITRRLALGTLGAGLASPFVAAQPAWPSRPVAMVVPYAPGGGTDIFARAVAEGMREAIGQPVVVENRAGANGVVGAEYVQRAPADGHMLMVATGAHVINRYAMPNIPFDPVKDFTPVSMLSGYPLVLAAHGGQPYSDIAGLIAAARAKPGSIAFGSTEAATSYAGNSFARQAGIQLIEVPYRGSGPQLNDLVAGHVPLAVTSTVAVLQHVASGAVRVLAVTSARRSALLPRVPTMAEAGLPGYEFNGWYGMYGPPGLPPAIAQRIFAAVQASLARPAIGQRLAELGADLATLGPAEFGPFLERDNRRWAEAAAAGLISTAN
ncbi:Bug family tripartite tricarboxylate transporter substrate binding protein [Belnapia rosea]|uniref:Tripartite-type tricarboxylate transporter, receptor component TctC n=1 Tax=Belnapia rosea TaxID=938405 RepID=A0A1G7BHC7_9PROT|nr:tripartite tricarboxylate transporter substrate binding protein [Belnapia rosea]SDB35823.1 Tripartite-type tricarboxylate transporter, receptor component TctC [Belnapia rosea]SDE26449.1 Tripartite-type tricarboxylate transporter, receptor component TctC [Belnapia rosea]